MPNLGPPFHPLSSTPLRVTKKILISSFDTEIEEFKPHVLKILGGRDLVVRILGHIEVHPMCLSNRQFQVKDEIKRSMF